MSTTIDISLLFDRKDFVNDVDVIHAKKTASSRAGTHATIGRSATRKDVITVGGVDIFLRCVCEYLQLGSQGPVELVPLAISSK